MRILKKLLIPFMGMILISCGEVNNFSKTDTNIKLPQVSKSDKARSINQSEIDTIKNSIHQLSWAYYQESRTIETQTVKARWYISNNEYAYVLSLMPIVNDVAGWGVVSETSGSMDIVKNTITIGNIPSSSTCNYFDLGLKQTQTNCQIKKDIELIRNSTVKLVWWFFEAPNKKWYIVNESSSVIYKFASINGQYDWQPLDIGVKPTFFVENGVKKLKFDSNAIFDLNSPTDESKNFPKKGCSFSDVVKLNKYYPYIIALCQSNIDVGTIASNYDKFEPNKLATWSEVTTVANYSANYNNVVNLCTSDKYINASKEQCHLDYASSKGFNDKLANESVTVGEAIVYTMSITYNKNFSVSEASQFLKNNGVLDDNISNTSKITRGQMAQLILSITGVYAKEATPSNLRSNTFSLPSLPIGINPPTTDTPLVDTESPSAYGEGIDIIDKASNCPNDPTLRADSSSCEYEGIKREVILPSSSIKEPVTMNIDTSTDMATKVVETAKESIGTTVPFVDSSNTHDMLFVNSVLGVSTDYATTTEMVDELKSQNKTVDLPNAQIGDIIVYNAEASSDNRSHLAIKVSDTTEVGLPNANGIQETPIVTDSVNTIIPLGNLKLPTIDTSTVKKNLFDEIPLITTMGNIYGELGQRGNNYFRFVTNGNKEVRLNFNLVNYDTPMEVDVYQLVYNNDANAYDDINKRPIKSRIVHDESIKFVTSKTAMYEIRIRQQGGVEYQKEDYKYKFNLTCDGNPCHQLGDFDSPTNSKYITIEETREHRIDYSGDKDYFLLKVPNTGLISIRIKSKVLNNNLVTINDMDSNSYTDMSAVMYRLKDNKQMTGTFHTNDSVYLDKGDYIIIVGQSNIDYDVEPYALQVYYPKSSTYIFTDITTNLMWRDDYETIDTNYQKDWLYANDYCNTLFTNGYQDWRLPTLDEFKTIIDKNKYPAIIDGFESTRAVPYWTATTTDSTLSRAYYVTPTGGIGSSDMATKYNIRCVRGEQK